MSKCSLSLGCSALVALALGACAPAAAPTAKPQAAATSGPFTAAPSAAPASVAAPAAPVRTPQPETIKVAFAADAAIYGPYFAAMDKGYFPEEGLEIDTLRRVAASISTWRLPCRSGM